jgi:endonuclease/exonuclease/phosphatase family metal-dependent hydrolase
MAIPLVLGAAIAALSFPVLVAGERDERPVVLHALDGERVVPPATLGSRTFRVMSLNLAHGRSDGRFQALQGRSRIRDNLAQAGELVRSWQPWAVALQEADGPSVWSGRFDHVEAVAQAAGMPWAVRSSHVDGAGLHYGTGMLAWSEPKDARMRTFAPSPPTMSKGVTFASMATPGGAEVTLVSVHLDFARAKVRAKQVRALAGWLSQVEGPLVVAGDFNCQWTDKEASLRALIEATGLHAWEPDSTALATYPGWNKRLDWILISKDLEFVTYRVLPDVVSDHRAVVADLQVSESVR